MRTDTNERRHLVRLLSAVLALGLLAAACGGGDDDPDEPGALGGEGQIEQIDLSGLSITVGSKDFTEQLILGQLLVQSFQAAGASVTDRTNLGGTQVNRQALLAGEINVYAEYNGTAWTEHLGNTDPSSNPEELTEKVRAADLERNNIRWLGRSPFNDTYGFAVGPDLADELDEVSIESMGEYLADNRDATVCMESEFPDRSDGLVLWEQKGGYDIPQDQIEILDTNLIYTETASGSCDFGEIFTTDGRIEALDLTVVDDDGAMIIYNVSINVRDDLYQQAPAAFDEIAELILSGLDEETMTELNKRVSVDGEDAAAVARDYLETEGLVGG